MKTTWKIVKLPHHVGPLYAILISGFRVGQTRNGRVCTNIDVDTFTDETFLVVAKWKSMIKDLCS